MQPNTHGIVARTKNIEVAHTINTQQLGRNINIEIVEEELLIDLGIVAVEVDIHEDIGLLARNLHPLTNHFGWQFVGGCRHTVLHIHGIHVGVGAQFKHHIDLGLAIVARIALNIFHAGNAIQSLLQRNDDRFHQQFVIGTGIIGHHIHLWRRY